MIPPANPIALMAPDAVMVANRLSKRWRRVGWSCLAIGFGAAGLFAIFLAWAYVIAMLVITALGLVLIITASNDLRFNRVEAGIGQHNAAILKEFGDLHWAIGLLRDDLNEFQHRQKKLESWKEEVDQWRMDTDVKLAGMRRIMTELPKDVEKVLDAAYVDLMNGPTNVRKLPHPKRPGGHDPSA